MAKTFVTITFPSNLYQIKPDLQFLAHCVWSNYDCAPVTTWHGYFPAAEGSTAPSYATAGGLEADIL